MDMAATHEMSVAEFLALPEDGRRHELLDGEHVVSPTPRWVHQRAVLALYELLTPMLRGRDDVEMFCVPGDLQLNPRSVVEPDLFILPSGPGPRLQDWSQAPVPIVVAEVVSPSTSARDRGIKRRLYIEAGVEEYWIVDLDGRVFERWRRGNALPEVVDSEFRFAVGKGISGVFDLQRYFADVLR